MTTLERITPDADGFTPNGWVDPCPHDELERPCSGPCCEPSAYAQPYRWQCQSDTCTASLRKPGECVNCVQPQPPTKRYDAIDTDWLRTRAAEIVADERFATFEELCPAPAEVLRNSSGSVYGTSIDAAVSEYEKYLSLM
jgi:hypothetical protein